MTPEIQARLERALLAPNPVAALTHLVNQLAGEGFGKQALYELYSDFFVSLNTADRDDEAQHVAEVLDAFVGWCAPEYRVLPSEPDVETRAVRRRT